MLSWIQGILTILQQKKKKHKKEEIKTSVLQGLRIAKGLSLVNLVVERTSTMLLVGKVKVMSNTKQPIIKFYGLSRGITDILGLICISLFLFL